MSSENVIGLLKTAQATMLTLGEENESLRQKVAEFERRDKARQIAFEMESKGLNADQSLDEKIASILGQDIEIVDQAVKMASSGAELLGVPSDRTSLTSDPKTALEAVIITGEF